MEELEKIVLLHDGDIFAYRAASATDGRTYVVKWDVVQEEKDGFQDTYVAEEHFKYKKDALLKCAETDGSWELKYFPEPESHAKHLVKKMIAQVKTDLTFRIKDFMAEFNGEEHYLTNKGSFRETIDPEYKMNRKDLRRPEHLHACKGYLTDKYSAVTRPGEFEADDLLTIRMTECQAVGYTPICVSIDKDLKQKSGWHWDFVKKELIYVNELDGLRSLYRQLLTGDTTDGIIGIKGMGPKTAAKRINGLQTEYDMYCVCLSEWKKFMKGESLETVSTRMNLNMRLLYLLRSYDEAWLPPEEREHAKDTRSEATIQGL